MAENRVEVWYLVGTRSKCDCVDYQGKIHLVRNGSYIIQLV